MIDAVVARIAEVVPDAEHVSLTVARRTGFVTLASTSPLAARADQIQFAVGEGPCVGTGADPGWFRSGDVEADARWPRWGPLVAESGVLSLLSITLQARGERIGALNMYSTRPDRFDEPETLELAVLYAQHVACAVSSARKVSRLEIAMSSRHTIGVAQGILMERYNATLNQAFAILQRASSVQNRKLRDIARELVETRRIDGFEADPRA